MAAGGTELLSETILKVIADRGKLDTWNYSLEIERDHQSIIGAVKSLESLGDVSEVVGVDKQYLRCSLCYDIG